MGKKAFQIKFDKNTLGNVGKNVLGAGAVAAAAGGAPLLAAGLGAAALGSKLFGKKSGPGPQLNTSTADQTQTDLQKQVAASRAASQGLISDLQAQSRGQGPSLADAQLRQAGNRNLAQQLASAASMRGGNPAALQRALVMQQGQQGRELAEQSATAKLQERQMAQQGLQGLVLGQQQQDLSQVMDPARLKADMEMARFNADVAKTNANKELQGKMWGSVLSTAGQVGAAAASDKNGKKDIKSGSKDVKSFLDALSAKSYEYKDTSKPGTAEGPRVGIMAQDLEKSKMGKTLVKDTPNGKMVDTVQGYGAILAAQAELNQRLKALEGKKKA